MSANRVMPVLHAENDLRRTKSVDLGFKQIARLRIAAVHSVDQCYNYEIIIEHFRRK